MYNNKEIIYIKALSPIHAGTGQALTSVDMPIQRERHSNIPKIEASSLKGSIKYHVYKKYKFNENSVEDEEYKLFEAVFGPKDGERFASAIGFTDARLLLFPMRSVTGIFKLITCPYVLNRWREDLELNKLNLNIDDGDCQVLSKDNNKVILEEYVFDGEEIERDEDRRDIVDLFEKVEGLKDNLDKIVILSDSDFVDMVTMYTEIITRNEIDLETGTAKGKGLFSEEYLPAETVLYFSVLESAFYNKNVMEYFNQNIGSFFQVGGNETIGKGIVKILDKVESNGGEN